MKKGETTKENIISTSLELFHSKGYNNTSINDIIKAAGIQKGGLYFHIQSKENLIISVLEEALESYERRISDGLEGLPPVEQVERKINAIVKYHLSIGLQKGCLFGNMALEIGNCDSEISIFLQKIFSNWEKTFTDLLAQGVEDGVIKLQESPSDFAKTIMASIEGSVMLSKISGEPDAIINCGNFLLKMIQDRKV